MKTTRQIPVSLDPPITALLSESGVWYLRHKDKRGEVITYSTGISGGDGEIVRHCYESGIVTLVARSISNRLTSLVEERINGPRMRMSDIVKGWVLWMRDSGFSEATISTYEKNVRAWIKFCGPSLKHPNDATLTQMHDFLNSDASGACLSSRRLSRTCLISFFTYLSNNGVCTKNLPMLARVRMFSAKKLKETYRNVRDASEEELNKLLDYLEDRHKKRPFGKWTMWYRFFRAGSIIAFDTGLRLSDVAHLEWSSITEDGKVEVLTRKRGKIVSVNMTERVANELSNCPQDDLRYVFPEVALVYDEKGASRISTLFKTYCLKAGVEGITFHSFRHSFITRSVKARMASKRDEALREVAKQVGHSGIATTEGYCHIK